MSVFRSAIRNTDGEVDAGYLALFWIMLVTVTLIPLIVGVGGAMVWRNPGKAAEMMSSMGVLIAALGGQCAAVVGAVGLFRAGDKTKESK